MADQYYLGTFILVGRGGGVGSGYFDWPKVEYTFLCANFTFSYASLLLQHHFIAC